MILAGLRWLLTDFCRRRAEKALVAVAWALPRHLCYWAAIRVIAHGTQGPWSSQEVPSLTAIEALRRWEKRP